MDQVSIFFFFPFFLAALCSLWHISVPQPGMELMPQAVQERSLNHWTHREASGQYTVHLKLTQCNESTEPQQKKKSARYFASILLLTNSSCFQRFAVINSPAMSLPGWAQGSHCTRVSLSATTSRRTNAGPRVLPPFRRVTKCLPSGCIPVHSLSTHTLEGYTYPIILLVNDLQVIDYGSFSFPLL